MPWQPAAAASDGKTYEWYKQDKGSSCACASILMLMHLRQNKKLSEDTVRGWCAQAEGGVNRSFDGSRDYEATGTQLDIIGTVLSEKLKINTSLTQKASTVRTDIMKARPTNPLICAVLWTTFNASGDRVYAGGGHAVLAVNHHGGRVIFLDPEAGVVEVPDASLLNYDLTYPGQAAASSGWIECVRMP